MRTEEQRRRSRESVAKYRAKRLAEDAGEWRRYKNYHNALYRQNSWLKDRNSKILYERKRRAKMLDFFGWKCAHCGFDDERALQFDHKNGDGHLDRKLRKTLSSTAWLWKLIQERPELAREGYQLLCANCNWIKRIENREFRSRRAVPARYMQCEALDG